MRRRLEQRLNDMMGVLAVFRLQMQRQSRMGGEGAEKLRCQAGVKRPYPLLPDLRLIHKIRPAADIHRRKPQRFIHRHIEAAESRDAAFTPQRLGKRFAEHNAGVFHRVVTVHMQITFGLYRQPETAVHGKRFEHMIKKTDAGGHLHPAAIEANLHCNVGLPRRFSASHLIAPPFPKGLRPFTPRPFEKGRRKLKINSPCRPAGTTESRAPRGYPARSTR